MTDTQTTQNISSLAANQQVVDQWLDGCYADRLRPAEGGLDQPYVDPGAAYTGVLWDWDAYFSCVGFASRAKQDPEIGRHAKGCVDNFVAFAGKDGSIPYAIMAKFSDGPDPDRVREADSERNCSKPLLAQFALLTVDHLGGADDAWLAQIRPVLEAYIDHWYDTQMTKWGVPDWRSHRGSGADNNPAYFQRPHSSVADPYLNSMMVRECQTLAEIARRSGADDKKWLDRAEALTKAINDYLWDPIDETYYCIDVGVGDPGKVRTPANWVVPIKVRACNMVMPLWAGVAPADRAQKVIEKHILDRGQLRSPHGLYTMAKCEPAFQIFTNYNPSDWCGPVWVISTYLAFRALMNYGREDDARAMAA